MGKLWGTVVEDWRLRPWWMSLMFYFCCYMTFIYMPFDMFIKPVAEDKEIWFGFTLTGWWAKATEPLHWLIYGLDVALGVSLCGASCDRYVCLERSE